MTIRPAYSRWPDYNRRLRDVVAALTDQHLSLRASPDRWPLWAIVGHTWHAAEVSGILRANGLPQVDLWD